MLMFDRCTKCNHCEQVKEWHCNLKTKENCPAMHNPFTKKYEPLLWQKALREIKTTQAYK